MMIRAVLLALVSVAVFGQKNPNSAAGRHTMVHLFEWKWTDIALECERFLGPKGFAGIQVSPPNEHAIVYSPMQPWWQRYQPVSYKLDSRSGSDAQFRDMVRRCNTAGVRIYVDAIINHMAAAQGGSTSGSSYNAGNRDFPDYSKQDFNEYISGRCSSRSGDIENYGDVNQVRNCRLVGLPDLNLEKDYVRGKIAGFLNTLIDIGVAGFRIDAAKHMWPGDLQNIFGRLKNLPTEFFPANSRPFIYQEVIDLGGEPIKSTDYTGFGRVTDFKYGSELSRAFLGGNKLKWLSNFGTGWGLLPDGDSVVFIDNHDNQRGHGGGGQILTHFESRQYKMSIAFMLAWPHGFAQLMSSYTWQRNFQNGKDQNDWIGPPHNADYSTKDVLINSDSTCGNGWVCEHRWRQIANMVEFRNVVAFTAVANWWDNGNNQIAFSRGNKGFIAINGDNYRLDQSLQTGLSAGTYCDVISGSKVNGQCTGTKITVGSDGRAQINIDNNASDPMVAIHTSSKL